MVEKMETDADKLFFVLIIKLNILIYIAKIEPFFQFGTKSSLRLFLYSVPLSKFWKNLFMYFRHKHVETWNQWNNKNNNNNKSAEI